MLSGRLKTFAATVAAIAAVFVFGGSRAEAALLLEVSVSGFGSQFYYATSSTSMLAAVSIDGYIGQVDTTTTNFSGAPSIGFISTTLNIATITGGSSPLVATVTVVGQSALLDPTAGGGTIATGPLTAVELASVGGVLSWLAPSGTPVRVTANTSTSSQALALSGSATTTTNYNAVSGPVTSGSLSLTALAPPSVLATMVLPNAGTYTLSQTITVTGASSIGAINITGTSTVNAIVPEPSTLVLAGLGALGFIGFDLRRRKAAGA